MGKKQVARKNNGKVITQLAVEKNYQLKISA